MLISMNPLRLYDIVAGYAKEKQKYVLVINMYPWKSLDSVKKEEVKNYYLDFIPVDEHAEIFSNDITFYEFNSEARATDIASEWFPPSTFFDDLDYFVYVQVITPGGAIVFSNKVTPKPA